MPTFLDCGGGPTHYQKNYSLLLPVEIWKECFLHLHLNDQINISLTCQRFNGICRPLIFTSIQYTGEVDFNKGIKPHEIKEYFLRVREEATRLKALSHSPKHAPHIRKLTLVYRARVAHSVPRKTATKAKELLNLYVMGALGSIPRFINLRTVIVKEFEGTLGKIFFTTIAKHPRIKNLSLNKCKFSVQFLEPRVKLQTLSILTPRSRDIENKRPCSKSLNLFSTEDLRTLNVDSATYSPNVFRALTSQGMSKNLTALSFRINYSDFHEFYAFLPTCPSLESLKIEYIPRRTPAEPPDPLPDSTVIPRLTSFTGPAVIASLFVPGRPVAHVHLDSYELQSGCRIWWLEQQITLALAERALPEISKSSAPITRLELDLAKCTADSLQLIVSHLPDLRFLRLSLSEENSFPGEDPRDIAFNSTLVPGNETSGGPIPPLVMHVKYLNILHWAAHGRITLPANLEELHVEEEEYYFKKGVDNTTQFKQAYTFSGAQNVLRVLGTRYSAFRLIWGSCENISRFSWMKRPDGRWEFMTEGNRL